MIASQVLSDTVENADSGFPGDFDADLTGAAVNPSCGDALVLRVNFLSGGSPYTDFNPTVTTP